MPRRGSIDRIACLMSELSRPPWNKGPYVGRQAAIMEVQGSMQDQRKSLVKTSIEWISSAPCLDQETLKVYL